MHDLQVERRRRPDRRAGVERRLEDRRLLADRRKMVPRRRVRESPGVHIRHAMQLLSRLEAVAPTDATREEFRVLNQRLWLAFQELTAAKHPPRRARWVAVAGVVGLLGAGVLVASLTRGAGVVRQPAGTDTTAASSTPPGPPTPPTPSPPPETSPANTVPVPAPKVQATGPGALDQRGDSLAAALQTYRDRFDLFQRKQMNCAGLESAFIAVNERWIGYGLQRKQLPGTLNPARAAADRSFYAAVDSTESLHDRSGCPRP